MMLLGRRPPKVKKEEDDKVIEMAVFHREKANDEIKEEFLEEEIETAC